jgi:hypothetical protein
MDTSMRNLVLSFAAAYLKDFDTMADKILNKPNWQNQDIVKTNPMIAAYNEKHRITS